MSEASTAEHQPRTDANHGPLPEGYAVAGTAYGERLHIVRVDHRSFLQENTPGEGPYGLCHAVQHLAPADGPADLTDVCDDCLDRARRQGLLSGVEPA